MDNQHMEAGQKLNRFKLSSQSFQCRQQREHRNLDKLVGPIQQSRMERLYLQVKMSHWIFQGKVLATLALNASVAQKSTGFQGPL